MSFDALARFLLSSVPNLEFLVIRYRCEFIQVVMVPANIFNHLGMALKGVDWVDRRVQLIGMGHVPQTDFVVI